MKGLYFRPAKPLTEKAKLKIEILELKKQIKTHETKQLNILGVSGSFSIVVWNKKENRHATNDEINFLVNGDDDNGQLFLAWNKVIVVEEDKGVIHLHIDSGEEDNYEIRYVR